MLSGRGTAILLGFLGAACGITSAHVVRPAGSTKQDDGKPGTIASVESDAPKTEQPATPLDLTKFRPLLAQETYAEVRTAVEEDKTAEAAEALSKMIASSGEPLKTARQNYLLGTLYRKAGKSELALTAYHAAAETNWILQDDARLAEAELSQAANQPDAAIKILDSLEAEKDSPRALGIRAASLADQKKYDEAATAWQKLIDVAETPEARLQLAEAIVSSAEEREEGEARKSRATEGALEAERARRGLPPESEVAQNVEALLKRAVASGAPARIEQTVEQKLDHLQGLVDRRDWDAAETAVQTIAVPKKPTYNPARCRYDYLLGKIHAAKRRWGEGADRIGNSAVKCSADKELHAWLLFNAGKYSAADGRHTQAVRFYADLERLYPENSLADDARLRAARSYQRQGVMARYVSLLAKMPEDYPNGDMTMEGVLTLALYRMERSDWSGAAQVLEAGKKAIGDRDSARGHEYSGTERYFLARARQKLGEEEVALQEFESIVRDVPLSYYMLHAYSRLLDADPKRAEKALEEGLERAKKSPFEFPHRPEYETPAFARGMELLRVGDTERGKRVLDSIGLTEDADDALLWGIALLYDRAGDAHTSHRIARGRLTDWFAHYPEGNWQAAWKIGFPRPYHSFVEKESKATGIPEWFIYGVMREESTFRPRVVSHADAYGLMQIIPSTARGIGRKHGLPYSTTDLKKPSVNIAIGSRVLKEMGRYFKKNPWLAIPGYNAGPGRPKRWLRERPNVDFDVWVEMIPFRETRRYTKRVLASRAAYAFLYYREESQTALVLPQRLTLR